MVVVVVAATQAWCNCWVMMAIEYSRVEAAATAAVVIVVVMVWWGGRWWNALVVEVEVVGVPDTVVGAVSLFLFYLTAGCVVVRGYGRRDCGGGAAGAKMVV